MSQTTKIDWLPEPRLEIEHRISDHVHDFIRATEAGDLQSSRLHQSWLMQTAANAVIAQHADYAEALRAYLAPLAMWSNKQNWGEPGDRWAAVGELLKLVGSVQLPLSQLRSASGRVPRRILGEIAQKPGIRPSELAERLKANKTNISNHLARLEREGLIHRERYGQNIQVYLARGEHDLLTRLQPFAELLDQIYLRRKEPKEQALGTMTKGSSEILAGRPVN